jgi:hypothetical protein
VALLRLPRDEHGIDGGWWLYRRIARKRNFTPGAYPSDITLVNRPQNDYWLGNIQDVSEAARHLRSAKQLSLSLLYWMQTEAGWKGLRLRPDIVGTEDGLAKYPYIRESNRIKAEFLVREQVGTRECRTGKQTNSAQPPTPWHGTGSICIPAGGDNYIDISNPPFQIPLGR